MSFSFLPLVRSFMMDGGAKMRRGADGGRGGNGGNVWVEVVRHLTGLDGLTLTKVKAENGGRGGKQTSNGKRGDDVVLPVPIGTVVWTEDFEVVAAGADVIDDDDEIDFSAWGTSNPTAHDGPEEGEVKEIRTPNLGSRPRGIQKGKWRVLGDLTKPGMRLLLAKGGVGGKGNGAMPVGKLAGSSNAGTSGEDITVLFELKVRVSVVVVFSAAFSSTTKNLKCHFCLSVSCRYRLGGSSECW